MTILIVISILAALILVHELGHFLAAKVFKIRVQEFGLGYPPRAISFGSWGGTEYTLNWIPFGGFVRLFGEEGESGQGSFAQAARYKQAIVLVAGVAMNAVAAYGLFVLALHSGIPRVVDHAAPDGRAQLIVSSVLAGSPALVAGLQQGDELIAISDARGASVQSLTPESVSDFVRERGGKQLELIYLRAGATSTVGLIPAHAIIAGSEDRPAIGVGLALVATESVPWGAALTEAWPYTVQTFSRVGEGLMTLARRALSGTPDLSDVVGPVGLVQIVGDASRSGIGDIFALAAFISVNLVFINLVPISL